MDTECNEWFFISISRILSMWTRATDQCCMKFLSFLIFFSSSFVSVIWDPFIFNYLHVNHKFWVGQGSNLMFSFRDLDSNGWEMTKKWPIYDRSPLVIYKGYIKRGLCIFKYELIIWEFKVGAALQNSTSTFICYVSCWSLYFALTLNKIWI